MYARWNAQVHVVICKDKYGAVGKAYHTQQAGMSLAAHTMYVRFNIVVAPGGEL